MTATLAEQYAASLPRGPVDEPTAVEAVDALLSSACAARASDIHLVPDQDGLAMQWRLDGVLHTVNRFPATVSRNIVARLKVLAGLLTYRNEVPQEGRLKHGDQSIEMRLSTFPTLHGEKAVIRLFVGSGNYRRLEELGLPADIRTGLTDLLLECGGVIALCGPAGSGKTTTAYACLREIVHMASGQRSLVTLEDPIEAVVSGVTQSQINATAGFDYHTGLKSLLRELKGVRSL